MAIPFAIEPYLQERSALVDAALDRYLPDARLEPTILHEAMRYSVFAGGKRLRPVLVIAAAEAVGGSAETVMPAACAIECIHTFSLIHDDLPCMDDDDYRRGKPTSHRVYGEAVALLTGDALLNIAYQLVAEAARKSDLPPSRWLQCMAELGCATGSRGMIGGQVMDMQAESKDISYEALQAIHRHKTGALLTVSLRMGAILSGAEEGPLESLTQYGKNVGLAFQIMDDILDVVGDERKIGKRVGSDASSEKATYPKLFGIDASRTLAAHAAQEALATLRDFDKRADPLRAIARFVAERER